MKTILKIIFTTILLLMMHTSFSAVITPVVNNGDWADAFTWDLGRIPEDLDVVNIPDGMTVIISSNLYHAVPAQPDLIINVYGILQMTGTGQINIGCGSKICVFGSGSIPSTGCNCNQINLGAGGAEWKGMHDATLTAGQCLTGNCFLPVTLTAFSGALADGKPVLSWASSEEVNFEHYVVERSLDGFHYEERGTVKGNAGEATLKNYSFTDEAPLASLAYYRLKMVDLDGSFIYSTIITVQKDLSVLTVFPNPVSSGENIRISVEDGAAGELMIQDLNGVEYFRSSFSSADNEMSEVSWNLPSGIYLVLFKGADFFRTSRLVVK